MRLWRTKNKIRCTESAANEGGGGSTLGVPKSAETKAKISESLKNYYGENDSPGPREAPRSKWGPRGEDGSKVFECQHAVLGNRKLCEWPVPCESRWNRFSPGAGT